jgi:hypothetical protein
MARLDDPEHEDDGAIASATTAPRSRGKSLGRIALEIALIAVGVFLGLMGEQWRERQQHRELAETALRRFRSEFQTNREAVAAVKDKHESDLKGIQAYLRADASTRGSMAYPFRGTNPAFLEYTAWDLALATQSLAFVDPKLAASIAHVYAVQRQLDGATRDITQVMYARAGESDPAAALRPFAIYFGDCTIIEPRLLKEYDTILSELDGALGNSSRAKGDANSPHSSR